MPLQRKCAYLGRNQSFSLVSSLQLFPLVRNSSLSHEIYIFFFILPKTNKKPCCNWDVIGSSSPFHSLRTRRIKCTFIQQLVPARCFLIFSIGCVSHLRMTALTRVHPATSSVDMPRCSFSGISANRCL